jgi:hypothetical protein
VPIVLFGLYDEATTSLGVVAARDFTSLSDNASAETKMLPPVVQPTPVDVAYPDRELTHQKRRPARLLAAALDVTDGTLGSITAPSPEHLDHAHNDGHVHDCQGNTCTKPSLNSWCHRNGRPTNVSPSQPALLTGGAGFNRQLRRVRARAVLAGYSRCRETVLCRRSDVQMRLRFQSR